MGKFWERAQNFLQCPTIATRRPKWRTVEKVKLGNVYDYPPGLAFMILTVWMTNFVQMKTVSVEESERTELTVASPASLAIKKIV